MLIRRVMMISTETWRKSRTIVHFYFLMWGRPRSRSGYVRIDSLTGGSRLRSKSRGLIHLHLFLDVNSSWRDWKASNIDAWKDPICCCKWMLSVLPRDFSNFDSIFCCKAVPGVGGKVFAGIFEDNDLKGRGWGCGGVVNKLSAALSRSAWDPVKKPTSSSPKRSSSSSLELVVSFFCFLT